MLCILENICFTEKVLYVEERDRPQPNQFQLAEVTDIVRLDMLKDALFDKTWHICKFTDGHVMGPGYGYLVKQMPYRDGIGHKLVVGPSEAAEGKCKYSPSCSNPFKPNGFFHSYYLKKSILHFRGIRLIFFSSLA